MLHIMADTLGRFKQIWTEELFVVAAISLPASMETILLKYLNLRKNL